MLGLHPSARTAHTLGVKMIKITAAAEAALRDVNRIKAPTKRAARIAELVTELPTLADVADFTAVLRRQAGVQDVTALPETTWTVRAVRAAHGTGEAVETVGLHILLNGATDVSISW